MQFTICGKVYQVTEESVLKALEDKTPNSITKYYIEVKGVKWPMKQVLDLALNRPPIAGQTTIDAYRVLDKLGFIIRET